MPRKKKSLTPNESRGEVTALIQANPGLLTKPSESEAKTLANKCGAGPRHRRSYFAFYLAHGHEPLEAYKLAGYLIAGDNAAPDSKYAKTPEQAMATIDKWLRSGWLPKIQAEYRVSVADRSQMLGRLAMSHLEARLAATKANGTPDMQARDNAAMFLAGHMNRVKKLQIDQARLDWDMSKAIPPSPVSTEADPSTVVVEKVEGAADKKRRIAEARKCLNLPPTPQNTTH